MDLRRAMKFLDDPPRFLFFTGKGGVGKTSVACAAALELVARGRRVLLVSTDPASNIGQVFDITIGNTITRIPAVPGLSALEIDPEEAAREYRARILAPMRGLLPDLEIAGITESLSGSCTTEIASFDEFTSLLTDDAAYGCYEHIIFDTAPTGHTIRLLQLPGSWTEFLSTGKQLADDYLAGVDPKTPSASPLFAPLGGLPPLLIQVGTADLLLSDAERLAAAATEAGVDVRLEIGEGLPHVYQLMLGTPEAAEATERIAAFLRGRVR